MAIPTARVKVEILKIIGLPAATLTGGDTRHAMAWAVAGGGPSFATGRSRPIPNAGGDFDVTPESWSFEFNFDPGRSIDLSVSTLEDHGDAVSVGTRVGAGTIDDPWTSGLRTVGTGPSIQIRVTTTLLNPVDRAFLARAARASGASGAVAIPQGFWVEIADIPGLYKPDPGSVPGSKHVTGYVSDDNLGRIFTNRLPNSNWARDTQFVDVQAKITAFGGATIPAGAKIDWTVVDVDDPTNDSGDFHREGGFYVDRNDYDPTGVPLGAHGDDNAGAFSDRNTNESLTFGAAVSGTARWGQAVGGPAPVASSATKAQTPITLTDRRNGTSSVRIHCPNVLGTNFIVRAGLTGTPASVPVLAASSGAMTMWSRIDVEVVRMAGAPSVSGALANIPGFFVPACVQMDFQPERVVTGALDLSEIATSDDDTIFDPAASGWVNNPGVFTHAGQPGWFFLGAARFPYPLPPPGSAGALPTGASYTLGTGPGNRVWVEVSGAAASADFVNFTWTDGAGVVQKVGFMVNRRTAPTVSGGNTKITLFGNDVTPDFTGHDADGSISHAMTTMILFFPQHRLPRGAALAPGGFGIPSSGALVEVFPPGAVFTTGVSPTVTSPATPGEDFFAGRTILFTHTPKFSTGTPPTPRPDFNQRVLSTVVHEFLHAFGMPHKCGHWNWRTPRQRSCCMNYFNTWLVDTSNNLVPGTVGKQGDDMCARHLMEVRRVHLERNLGLNW